MLKSPPIANLQNVIGKHKTERNEHDTTRMSFDKRLFIWLTTSFIFATVIGTLTHEGGHYIMARSFGYEAHINYMSSWWTDTKNSEFTDTIYSKYRAELMADKDFPEKEKYKEICKVHGKNGFWITLGGPLETVLTGTIGLLFLFAFRKSFDNVTKLTFRQWFLIFVSLFWLRQTANLFTWVGSYFVKGEFSQRGDEIHLAHHFNLPEWTIITLTAIIGAIVLSIIIFKFVPTKQRLTFIASGLVGGIAGYILWLELFGKVIMP